MSLSVVSVSDWFDLVSIGCWFSTVRPFSLEGEALSEVDNLVNNFSIVLTVEWSLVTKLVRLERLLGRLSKGGSKGCLVDVVWTDSKLVSFLSNCLPIVFKHWSV